MADLNTQLQIAALPVHIDADSNGRRRLLTTRDVAAGGIIVPLIGSVHSTPSRYSIQIGERAHLDDFGPLEATNHSCEPSAAVDFTDLERLVLRAVCDLSAGMEITINYCATEEEMVSPFVCDCGSGACCRRVRGYRFLSPAQRASIDDRLSPYLRSKYRVR